MKRILPSFFVPFVLLAALAVSEWAAHAATYNFYFNNTEQGDNSTATPNVTVNADGKVTKKPGAEPAQAASPATASAPLAENASSTAKSETAPMEFPIGSDRTAHFRLNIGAGEIFEATSMVGPFFDLGFFANKYVGVNLFGGSSPLGWYYSWARSSVVLGGELELTPLHLGTGAHPDIVELGLLAGASTIYPAADNWLSPHLGARVSVNFGNYMALTAAIRGNVSYVMGEGGFALRL